MGSFTDGRATEGISHSGKQDEHLYTDTQNMVEYFQSVPLSDVVCVPLSFGLRSIVALIISVSLSHSIPSGKSPTVLAEIIQPELDTVIKWGNSNGLHFNPAKTCMVLFNKNPRKPAQLQVNLGGKALELHASLKYLGLEIQRNLSWTSHVTTRINKCKFLLHKCKGLISTLWGLSPYKMDWLYKAVIRPKLTYGALVWSHKITMSMSQKMAKLQRLAMVAITQPLRSTPTAGLEALLGWIPLPLHAQEVGLRAYQRTKQTVRSTWDGIGNSPSAEGHIRRWSKKEREILDENFPREVITEQNVWKDSEPPKTKMGTIPLVIYTDASKEDNNVGFGWHASLGDYIIKERVSPLKEINIFLAELLAIQDALTWLHSNYEEGRPIHIYCDSQSVVQVLNRHHAKGEAIIDTMTLLRRIGKLTPMDLSWVKGHNDNTGNEYADSLARRGANESRNMQFAAPYMPISPNSMKKLVHAHFMWKWQDEWDQLKSCRISKMFYPRVREDKNIVKRPVRELSTLAKICTGHGLFKDHIRHWNELEGTECSLCQEDEEDSWHLWDLCPATAGFRLERIYQLEAGYSFETLLLKFMNSNQMKVLMASNECLLAT